MQAGDGRNKTDLRDLRCPMKLNSFANAWQNKKQHDGVARLLNFGVGTGRLVVRPENSGDDNDECDGDEDDYNNTMALPVYSTSE